MDQVEVYGALLRQLNGSSADVYRDAAAEVLGVLPEVVTQDQRLEVKRLAWGMVMGVLVPPYCHWCSVRHSGPREHDGKYCPWPLLEPDPSWARQ